MEIYYISGTGARKLDLVRFPYRIQTGDILDYNWDYESVGTKRYGGKITRFTRGIREMELTMSVAAEDRESYRSAIRIFNEVAETDLLNMTPGRLFVNDMYMTCYIKSSQKSEWEADNTQLDVSIKLLTEYPFWIEEETFSFGSAAVLSQDNKSYSGRYRYRYIAGVAEDTVHNDHYAECNFLMQISGPVQSPAIFIDDYQYQVKTLVEAGEYLEIDSVEKTVVRVLQDGTRTNEFHSRAKETDVFRPIPPGQHQVNWNGDFAFNLTIYKERSEPGWQ